MHLQNTGASVSRNIVRGNKIFCNSGTARGLGFGSGTFGSGNVYEDNHIYDAQDCMLLDGGRDSIIRNNRHYGALGGIFLRIVDPTAKVYGNLSGSTNPSEEVTKTTTYTATEFDKTILCSTGTGFVSVSSSIPVCWTALDNQEDHD